MPLPEDIQTALSNQLGGVVVSVQPVSGGDISSACRIEFEGGRRVFVKWGAGSHDLFEAESDGLIALAAADTSLVVPVPLAQGTEPDKIYGFVALPWLETVAADESHWTGLARGIASLHRCVKDRYGFNADNFIGRRRQRNAWRDDWVEFFLAERLEPQVQMAVDFGIWPDGWTARFERLKNTARDLLPARPEASLVHGDLWGGNVMPTRGGPALVDPAVYYGHREVDLAMSELFGRFDAVFYASYENEWAIDSGYGERRDLYNLYHLINHLNHFGTGYARSVDEILDRYGS